MFGSGSGEHILMGRKYVAVVGSISILCTSGLFAAAACDFYSDAPAHINGLVHLSRVVGLDVRCVVRLGLIS